MEDMVKEELDEVSGSPDAAATASQTDTIAGQGAADAASGQESLESLCETLKKERDDAIQELADAKEQFLRKAADLENSRKRFLRDKEDAIAFANRNLLNDLVIIIDDFERAIKASESSQDYATLFNGIQMIEKQFVGMLERKYGLQRFDSANQQFDPTRHEAVAMEDRGDHHLAIVLEDYQKGYILNERVLRTAKVKVSNPLGQVPEATEAGTDEA